MTHLPAFTLQDLRRWSPRLGLGALALAGLIAVFAPAPAAWGYLSSFYCWLSLPLSCCAILMLWNLVGGRWEAGLRPLMASAASTIPAFALLFLPVLLGRGLLFEWTYADTTHAELIAAKATYLNLPFFTARAAAFFVIWTALGLLFFRRRWSRTHWLPGPAAVGLVLLAVTITFAAIDWLGTLQVEWFSSVFGLYVIVSHVCLGFAVLVLAVCWLHDRRALPAQVGADALHDLSNILLAFVTLHAYLAYSQYFITWNGNLPHEVAWYVPRLRGGWAWYVRAMIVIDFLIPFIAMLSADIKRSFQAMRWIAGVVLLGRVMEAIWFVIPVYGGSAIAALLLALLAFVGIGGIWMALFLGIWTRGPLVAADDAPQEVR